MSGIAFVLPLKPGERARAKELLTHAPPFDPRAAGLDRYRVFLTEAEAIFVFNGAARGALERIRDEARAWAQGAAWDELLAGPPRLAQVAYAWERIERLDDISSAPTPGPGDSDGGDVFAP